VFLNYYQSTEYRLLTVDKVLNNNNIDVYIAMVEGGQLNEPTMTRFQITLSGAKLRDQSEMFTFVITVISI